MVQPISNNNNTQHQFTPLLRELEAAKKVFFELIFSGKDNYKAKGIIKDAEKAYEEGKISVAMNLAKEAMKELEKTREENPEFDKVAPRSFKNDDEERVYKDISDDPNVSFKTPTGLNKYQAELEVRAHENQHVRHELFEAVNNKEVAKIYVRFKYGLDKSGKLYLKGGETVVKRRKAIEYKIFNPNGNKIDIKK